MIISKFLISDLRSDQTYSKRNFFRKIHFSLVLFVIEMFLIPDFFMDRITEGETPPAPIIRPFYLDYYLFL